ncbi:hypothetical protein [Rhizobium sp. MHM7A]|uniref:hypothetical protein n=1 Tax=Rhizobium sp. MHM7A TaxID=2583233 RepID=UPI001105EDF0|nr:hypothetical protein [Rhizobium sp. MHM7A]TLX17096.1 hypothetical protein FFR93_07215 [Rhizobium sp. MHM7A]
MKSVFLAALLIPFGFTAAHAFEATITRAGSIKPHPVTSVAKGELEPIEGVAIAKPREEALYQPEIGGRASSARVTGKIPVPTPRPLIALACPIVWPD